MQIGSKKNTKVSKKSPGGLSTMNQNQPLINDDSSEEDLKNYLKSRRNESDYKEGLQYDSSGDSDSSDGSDSDDSPDARSGDEKI